MILLSAIIVVTGITLQEQEMSQGYSQKLWAKKVVFAVVEVVVNIYTKTTFFLMEFRGIWFLWQLECLMLKR